MAGRAWSSHRLSSGLVVSGPPETKAKPKVTMSSAAVPYTGGDLKKSGDLGKMFEMPTMSSSESSVPAVSANSKTHSGPLARLPSVSTPKKSSSSSSGPLALPATGLITSGLASASSSARRSGGQGPGEDQTPMRVPGRKKGYGPSVTVVGRDRKCEFAISAAVVLTVVLGLVLLSTLGLFLLVAVKNIVVLLVACVAVAIAVAFTVWNWSWRHNGLEAFLRALPDADLYGAANDQFVKVSGVVTCGSIPLETSYQNIPRCVFVSTELYEYRGWKGKQANPNHRRFTWGLRHAEKHVADFYISDSRRGLRALVKAGHGAKVVSFIKPTNKIEINKENKGMHPAYGQWLEDCNLSFDDRVMRLEEGYVKEGSTVTVVGILQRHDNILMIVPSLEPISTGCLWRRLLLSMNVKGLVLIGDENPNDEVVTV